MFTPKEKLSSRIHCTPKIIQLSLADVTNILPTPHINSFYTPKKPIHMQTSKSLSKMPESTKSILTYHQFKLKPSFNDLKKYIIKQRPLRKKIQIDPVNIHMTKMRISEKLSQMLPNKHTNTGTSHRITEDLTQVQGSSRKKISLISLDFKKSRNNSKIL
ncbi:hypothetical protein SteCoe_24914 [Stentor coeruleus]|uniref:Uncharacterized protein n=1 Tax=Stentor coeruleus TaxID=5963 RepID=A0A1R2BGG0_9CILI|nr:hypothetical protein SteCoe_24914 [Stentor coeruleus]